MYVNINLSKNRFCKLWKNCKESKRLLSKIIGNVFLKPAGIHHLKQSQSAVKGLLNSIVI